MLKCPKKSATSVLIHFVPRQVIMLDSKSKKPRAKSIEISEFCSIDPKTLATNSVAAFLERNGLDKTLAVFRYEARMESDLKASSINLEDLVCKFLESSKGCEEAAINGPKEKGSKTTGISAKIEVEHIHVTQGCTNKKKRKQRRERDDGSYPRAEHELDKNSVSSSDPNDLEKLKSGEDSSVEIKDKRKKKKSFKENADKNNLEVNSGVAKFSVHGDKSSYDSVSDEARRKKHKVLSDACDWNTDSRDHPKLQAIVKDKMVELNSSNSVPSSLPTESNAKQIGEKKRKKKAEATSNENKDKVLKESEAVVKKAETSGNDDIIEKKACKKRKRLESEERMSPGENESVTKDSKHISLKGSKNNKESESPQQEVKSIPDNDHMTAGKKRKTENGLSSKETWNTSPQEQDFSTEDAQKELGTHQLANGKYEDEKEEGTALKYIKKERR